MRHLALLVALAPLVAACHKSEPIASDAPTASASASAGPNVPAVAAPAPTPVEPSPLEKIGLKTSLADALTVAKPEMADTFNKSSKGTLLLTAWALKHMTWADVAVAKDETSRAKVMKDADEERGKRLCVRGRLVQIEAHKEELGKFYTGLLGAGAGNLYHFHAVKSTGELTEKRPARFCGVVTGRFDYSNSGGGTGHAIDMVGIFDLPENHEAK
jgi:hypothetical protein